MSLLRTDPFPFPPNKIAPYNARWRLQFRYSGSCHESAAAQLSTLRIVKTPARIALGCLVAGGFFFALAGWKTDIFNQFHGEARNMRRDAGNEQLRCDIPGYCSGPSIAGGRFVGFGLPTQGFSVFLFYPKLEVSESLATNTAPPLVDAWLIRTNNYPWSDARKCGNPEEIRLLGGERLTGRIVVKWRNNADFRIEVDLVANDTVPAGIVGEFVGYTKTRFDPAEPFRGLAMLFFGPRASKAAVKPTIADKP